ENLVSVYLPKATGKSSFLGEDSAVTNLTIGTLENKALYNNEIIKTVNLTNAKSIGDDALRECTKITSVYMPLVSTVGERAFYGCTNLTNVTAPELKTAKALSFANCSNLKNTKMNKLQIIGDRAFENDSMLTEVTINNTVQSVGSKAFGNCIRLKKANLGTGLTKIGDYAFFNCYQYESTLKPLNVTSIGTKAFYNCKKMPCKTVGRKCKTIGVEAFVGCSKIASLYIPTSTTSIGKNISGNAKVNEGYSTSTTAKPNFKIYCVKNSQAYKYADKYNFIKNKKMAYAVTSISLNKTSLTLNKGKSYVLKPTYNSNASVKKVTYTTSNSKVATVSTSGKLTAKSKGSCVVSATAIDGSYVVKSCKVVVK
ncbi:MAG: leucine-rich repeat protein, partial [Ruminococcus sp.]